MNRFFIAVVLLLLPVVPARADLITSPGQVRSPSKVVNFSQFNGSFMDFSAQPIQVGGLVGENITVQSTDPTGSVIGSDTYLLGNNGQWTAARNGFVGLDSVDLNTGLLTGALTFRFNGAAVSQVGAFLNYVPDPLSPDVTIAALNAAGNVLESFDISALAPINTPNGTDAGAFRGISRAQADIAGFRVSNQFAVVDDLTFSRTPGASGGGAGGAVPEPGTLALFGVGLVAVGAWRRRTAVKR